MVVLICISLTTLWTWAPSYVVIGYSPVFFGNCSHLLPIKKKIGLFVILLLYNRSSLFWLKVLCQIYMLWILSPCLWVVYSFLNDIFWWADAFNFDKVQFYQFFLWLMLCVLSVKKKILPIKDCGDILLYFILEAL